jgi:hypothetical protein
MLGMMSIRINDKLIEGEISAYENQEGELVTRPEYRTDILNQLLFSGVTVGGEVGASNRITFLLYSTLHS